MSKHILMSFSNENWEKDPQLTQDLRKIFNTIMNTTIPENERKMFKDPKDFYFDPDCNLI